MKKLYKCDLCESEKLKKLYKSEDYNLGFDGKFTYHKCENCGLIFLNPQPSFKEIENYYVSDIYYPTIEDKLARRGANFIRKLQEFSVKHHFVFKAFLFLFSSFVRGIKIIPNGKYLDVGCGGGQFLFEIKMLNSSGEYYGVEPGNFDEEDVKKYGLKVFKGTLEDANYPDNYFDVVTVYDVIAHVSSPSETMKRLKRILKPNGTLILRSLNSRSLEYKLFGKYWYHLDCPRHFFICSDEHLEKYGKKFNFKIEKIRYCSGAYPLSFFNSALNYFSNLQRKRFKHISMTKNRFYPFMICFFVLGYFFSILCDLLKLSSICEIHLKQ